MSAFRFVQGALQLDLDEQQVVFSGDFGPLQIGCATGDDTSLFAAIKDVHRDGTQECGVQASLDKGELFWKASYSGDGIPSCLADKIHDAGLTAGQALVDEVKVLGYYAKCSIRLNSDGSVDLAYIMGAETHLRERAAAAAAAAGVLAGGAYAPAAWAWLSAPFAPEVAAAVAAFAGLLSLPTVAHADLRAMVRADIAPTEPGITMADFQERMDAMAAELKRLHDLPDADVEAYLHDEEAEGGTDAAGDAAGDPPVVTQVIVDASEATTGGVGGIGGGSSPISWSDVGKAVVDAAGDLGRRLNTPSGMYIYHKTVHDVLAARGTADKLINAGGGLVALGGMVTVEWGAAGAKLVFAANPVLLGIAAAIMVAGFIVKAYARKQKGALTLVSIEGRHFLVREFKQAHGVGKGAYRFLQLCEVKLNANGEVESTSEWVQSDIKRGAMTWQDTFRTAYDRAREADDSLVDLADAWERYEYVPFEKGGPVFRVTPNPARANPGTNVREQAPILIHGAKASLVSCFDAATKSWTVTLSNTDGYSQSVSGASSFDCIDFLVANFCLAHGLGDQTDALAAAQEAAAALGVAPPESRVSALARALLKKNTKANAAAEVPRAVPLRNQAGVDHVPPAGTPAPDQMTATTADMTSATMAACPRPASRIGSVVWHALAAAAWLYGAVSIAVAPALLLCVLASALVAMAPPSVAAAAGTLAAVISAAGSWASTALVAGWAGGLALRCVQRVVMALGFAPQPPFPAVPPANGDAVTTANDVAVTADRAHRQLSHMPAW